MVYYVWLLLAIWTACMEQQIEAFPVPQTGSQPRQSQPSPRLKADCMLRLVNDSPGTRASSRSTGGAGLTSAVLHCSTSGNSLIQISVDDAIQQSHVAQGLDHFQGVEVVDNLPCKQQLMNSSSYALIYFCGDYDVTLVQPAVYGVVLPDAHGEDGKRSAVIAIGGSVGASIVGGNFVDNQAGHMLSLLGQAQVTLQASSVRNNTAHDGVAAVLVQTASLVISNSTIVGNHAAANGGALVTRESAMVTITNQTIVGSNSAESIGGAVMLVGQSKLIITGGSIVTNNSAFQASIWVSGSSSLVVDGGSVLSQNKGQFGGALGCTAQSHCSIMPGVVMHSNKAAFGAVAYVDNNASFTAINAVFMQNSAERNLGAGGVLHVKEGGQARLQGCSFLGNTARDAGGAVYSQSGPTLVFTNCTFTGNSAPDGGAFNMRDTAQLTLNGSTTLSDNQAVVRADGEGGTGGALSMTSTTQLIMSETRLVNNTAQTGGAIHAEQATGIHISSSNFSRNHASLQGGALYAKQNATVSVVGSILTANSAKLRGGALFATDSSNAVIADSIIMGNSPDIAMGGVGADGVARLSLTRAVVESNTATVYAGGLGLDDGATLIDVHETRIADNHATWGGGFTFSNGHIPDLRSVHESVLNNSGAYDQAVSVAASTLLVIGNNTIADYVSRVGDTESFLPILLSLHGRFGVPCEGLLVQAQLHGTQILAVNRSDSSGTVLMNLGIRQPPGVYLVVFDLVPGVGQQPLSSLQPANMTVHVRSCRQGEVTVASGEACQLCPADTYSVDPSKQLCDKCPAGAECPGGFQVVAKNGFWHSWPLSAQLHKCPNPAACGGDRMALLSSAENVIPTQATTEWDPSWQCSAGYRGNLCGNCAQGYSLVRPFTCRECMHPSVIVGLYVLAVFVMLCFMKLLCHLTLTDSSTKVAVANVPLPTGSNRPHSLPTAAGGTALSVSDLFRPLVLYTQYCLILGSLPGMELPASLAYPLKALAWAWAPASPETVTVSCILPNHTWLPAAIQRVLFALAMPVIMLCLLLTLEATILRRVRSRRTAGIRARDRLAACAMVVCFFFMPSVSRIAFGMFACIPIDSAVLLPEYAAAVGSFWVHDVSQVCYQGYHQAWALGLGVPLLALVCGVLPAAILWVTLGNKDRLSDPVFMQHYGFLVKPYRLRCCFWEAVLLVQTTVLTAISVFGHSLGSFAGLVFNIALSVVAFAQAACSPHAAPAAGHATMQAIGCLYFTSVALLSFSGFENHQPSMAYALTVGGLVATINVIFVLSMIWRIARLVEWRGVVSKVQALCNSCSTTCVSNCSDMLRTPSECQVQESRQ